LNVPPSDKPSADAVPLKDKNGHSEAVPDTENRLVMRSVNEPLTLMTPPGTHEPVIDSVFVDGFGAVCWTAAAHTPSGTGGTKASPHGPEMSIGLTLRPKRKREAQNGPAKLPYPMLRFGDMALIMRASSTYMPTCVTMLGVAFSVSKNNRSPRCRTPFVKSSRLPEIS
jgi:hypothetical protein